METDKIPYGAMTDMYALIQRRIVDVEEAQRRVRGERLKGRKIIFTNGCFDLLHAGHIKLLGQAKAYGDVLIVGLNSDRSIRQIKGGCRPVVDQHSRALAVAALLPVDMVVVFDEPTPERLIRALEPDVLIKGADWHGKEVVGAELVQARGGSVHFVDLEEGYSSSSIIEQIIDRCA